MNNRTFLVLCKCQGLSLSPTAKGFSYNRKCLCKEVHFPIKCVCSEKRAQSSTPKRIGRAGLEELT